MVRGVVGEDGVGVVEGEEGGEEAEGEGLGLGLGLGCDKGWVGWHDVDAGRCVGGGWGEDVGRFRDARRGSFVEGEARFGGSLNRDIGSHSR